MRYFDPNDRSFCSMIMYDNKVVEKKKFGKSIIRYNIRTNKGKDYVFYVEMFDNIYFRIF